MKDLLKRVHSTNKSTEKKIDPSKKVYNINGYIENTKTTKKNIPYKQIHWKD